MLETSMGVACRWVVKAWKSAAGPTLADDEAIGEDGSPQFVEALRAALRRFWVARRSIQKTVLGSVDSSKNFRCFLMSAARLRRPLASSTSRRRSSSASKRVRALVA